MKQFKAEALLEMALHLDRYYMKDIFVRENIIARDDSLFFFQWGMNGDDNNLLNVCLARHLPALFNHWRWVSITALKDIIMEF